MAYLLQHWPIALFLLALLCVVGLICFSIAARFWERRARQGLDLTDSSDYVGDTTPKWASVVCAILIVVGIISLVGGFVGIRYQRDRTPTPESATVVLPVTTTDQGTRVLLIRERHNLVVPIVCKPTECSEMAANEHIVYDKHYDSDGYPIYENPRKE